MEDTKWYLRKAQDGSEFGPVDFEQLRQWAAEAQIAPMDRVSTDKATWLKAPMVPELAMDYLIEVGEDMFYGPTTIGALREFLTAGEITLETKITNCKDTTQTTVRDLLEPQMPAAEGTAPKRGVSSIRVNLQQRIRELETRLEQERRARETAEHLVHKLEDQLARLTRH